MSAVVPLIFWGSQPPSHYITAIAINPKATEIATGCSSGFICTWSLITDHNLIGKESINNTDKSSGQIISTSSSIRGYPRSVFIGASEGITTLCYSHDGTSLYSAGHNGDIIRWDTIDGACCQQTNLVGNHTGLRYLGHPQTYPLLLVYGNYCEAYILNAKSLDLVITLTCEDKPNWLSAMIEVPLSLHHKDTHLLAISKENQIKIWDIPRLDLLSQKESEIKPESKCRNASFENVEYLSYWPKIVAQKLLVVGFTYFKVLSVNNKSQLPELCHMDCITHVFSLSGGEFIDDCHILIWSRMGSAYIYSFLHDKNKELYTACFVRKLQPGPRMDECLMDTHWCVLHRGDQVILAQGNQNGTLHVWELGDCEYSDSTGQPVERNFAGTTLLLPNFSISLKDSWAHLKQFRSMNTYLSNLVSSFPAITPSHIPLDVTIVESSWKENDPLFAEKVDVTSILYIPELGKVVCGMVNGYVVIFNLTQALEDVVLNPNMNEYNDVMVMKAHKGRVSALLYPRHYSDQFNCKHLLTGGADGAIRVWDILTKIHIHCFLEHVGEVLRLKVCPKMTNTRLNCGVCSVGRDNSVAIISLTELREILMCSNHCTSITHVRWKPVDDLMLVRCKDGKVYIWQMDTGVLDRVLTGPQAEDILTMKDGHLSGAMSRRDSAIKAQKLTKSHIRDVATIKTYQAHHHDSQIVVLLIHVEMLIEQLTQDTNNHPQGRSSRSDSKTEATRISTDYFELSLSPIKPSYLEKQLESEFFKKLLLSCLHSWGMDEKLDASCQEHLNLKMPNGLGFYPQYGLNSKYNCLNIYFPGWGLDEHLLQRNENDRPQLKFPLSHKWKLSPGITTQHLLALTSVCYCSMLVYSKDQFRPNSDESCQRKLTVCSQMNTLNCVFLPDMLGVNFIPPHLSSLAIKWPYHNSQMREAAQALLLAQLRSFTQAALEETVRVWYASLPLKPISLRGGVKGITYGNTPINRNSLKTEKYDSANGHDYLSDPDAVIKAKDYLTSIIILSVIAAEFNDFSYYTGQHEPASLHDSQMILQKHEVNHVASCLQGILCCPISPSCSLQGYLRRAAAELISKGFNVFFDHLDIPSVMMALFEIAVTRPVNTGQMEEVPHTDYQLARQIAGRALNNIFQTRTDEMIEVLAKEVRTLTLYLGSTHSLIPVPGHEHQEPNMASGIIKTGMQLVPRIRSLLLKILEELIKKRIPHLLLMIVEFTELVLFCIGYEELKNKKIEEVFPLFDKLGCYTHCPKTGHLAVGTKSGSVGLFDLKHHKMHEFSAHMSPLSCIAFSLDGKYLASYSLGSCELRFWQVSTPIPILGQVVNPTVKRLKTQTVATPNDDQPIAPHHSHTNNFRLFWVPKQKNSVILLGEHPKTVIEFYM